MTSTVTPGAGDPADDRVVPGLPDDFVERLNADFDDSVLLLARVLGDRPEARSARVTGLDRHGVDLVASEDGGDHHQRVAFAGEVADAAGLTAELLALVARARDLSGEEGVTAAERVAAEAASIRTFLTHVVDVEDVNPSLRRITFGGSDLAGFSPLGPDTFVYVLLPPPGRTELTIGRDFSWETVDDMPEGDRPVGAYYTVRRWRPERQELDVLCVLHDHAGPASAWVARARPGDPVALWGPRTGYEPPPDTDRLVLVADEAGLPAVAAILEGRPAGMPATVFAEVADLSTRQDLPTSPPVDVTWLHRDGAPAGTTTLLADAVRAMPWPGGSPYVWGGGESRVLAAIRNYVRQEVGLARDRVSLVAYWRHAGAAGD